MLAWLLIGLTALTRPGERAAVRLACGFRHLSPTDIALLTPVWREVCLRCGVSTATVDLYTQRSPAINAYTVGSRSVAVTSRVVSGYRDGMINADMLRGILAHELGHHATHCTRLTLVTLWLAAPWRMVYRTVIKLCARLTGPQSSRLLVIVVAAAFGISFARAEHAGQWSTVGVLSALGLFVVVTPLADAAISRSSERAADRFAAHIGYSAELALALATLDSGHHSGPLARLVERHPRTPRRIEDLEVGARHEATNKKASGLLAA